MAPKFPIRVGLVGLGVISQRSLLPHFDQPDAKEKLFLAAVCDVVEDRARQVAELYGVPEHYSDLDDMLRNAPIDAVLICTPIHLHHVQAINALSAGKHAYVQKTIATTVEDAQQILAYARDRDLILVASPEQMLNPARQAALQLITSGAIGPVYWALCPTDYGWPVTEEHRLGDQVLDRIDPTWYFKAGGGPVFNMTVYALHTLTSLLGPVKRVSAMSGRRVSAQRWKGQDIAVEAVDNTIFLLDFSEGVFAVASGSTATPARSIGWGHLCVFGANGALELYSDRAEEPNLANVVEIVGCETWRFDNFGPYLPPVHAGMADPHVYEDIMYFVECIAAGECSYANVAQAVHAVEVIEKGYLAARTGQVQEIETGFEI